MTDREHKINIPDEWLVGEDGRRFELTGEVRIPRDDWVLDLDFNPPKPRWHMCALYYYPILRPVELTGIDWLRWAAEHRPGWPFEVQHDGVVYRLAIRQHRFQPRDPPHIQIIMLAPRADIITRHPNNGGAIFLSLVKHGLDPSVLCDANVTWLVSERRGEE